MIKLARTNMGPLQDQHRTIQMVKIGPKNKQVDFSEGVLAAEGGEQAILKMGVIIHWDIYGAIYRYIWAVYMIYMAIYEHI